MWHWDNKYPMLVKAAKKVTKETQVPSIGHRFGHQSGLYQSSEQTSPNF